MGTQQLDFGELREWFRSDNIQKVITTINLSDLSRDSVFQQLSNDWDELVVEITTKSDSTGKRLSYQELEAKRNDFSARLLSYISQVQNALLKRDPEHVAQQIRRSLDKQKSPLDPLSELGKDTSDIVFLKLGFNAGDSRKNELNQELESYLDEWLEDDNPRRNIVILGEGGMGKSTFLSHYCCLLTNRILESGKDIFEHDYIPLFASMHSAFRLAIDQTEAYFIDVIQNRFSLTKEAALDLLHTRKFLLILDSFDEMGQVSTQNERIMVFKYLRDFLMKYKGNKVLLAGRPSFFRDKEERQAVFNPTLGEGSAPRFEEVHLLPLSDDDIRRYMQLRFKDEGKTVVDDHYKWLMIEREEDKNKEPDENRKELKKLARHPFFLHLICSAIEDTRGEFEKETGTAIYLLLNLHVERWIDRQSNQDIKSSSVLEKLYNHDGNSLIRKVVFRFFTGAALAFYERGKMKNEELKNQYLKIELTYSDLKNVYRDVFESGSLQLPEDVTEEELLEELITGFFLKGSEEGYIFLHDYFLYYFIARHIIDTIKEDDKNNPIIQKLEWNEPTFAMVGKTLEKQLKGLPEPALYSWAKGKSAGKRRNWRYRTIARPILKALRLIHYLLANSILLVLATALLGMRANMNGFESIGNVWFLGGGVIMVISMIMTTKAQKLWNFGFRTVARESRKQYSLIAKAFKLAFHNGVFTQENDLDLMARLMCTYHIFRQVGSGDGEKDQGVVFDKVVILKQNQEDTKFRDFTLRNGSLFIGHAFDCIFERTSFENSSIYLFSFVGCQFRDVDFSGLKMSKLWFFQMWLVRKITWLLRFTKGSPNPNMYLMEFTQMAEEYIDDKSLRSLQVFIQKYNLKLGKHIYADDWMVKRLSDPIALEESQY